MVEKETQSKEIKKGNAEVKVNPRGQSFTGRVVSAKMNKTAVVEWDYLVYSEKYERYERRKTRVSVHNPEEIHALVGDNVKITECRPLSKTKHFVIVEKLKVVK